MVEEQAYTAEAYITIFVRENKDEIERILSSNDLTIVEKASSLRRMARKFAEANISHRMSYRDLEDFKAHYDRGGTPLDQIEGPGFRKGEMFILKSCPMVPVFSIFKKNGEFPEFWTSVTAEFLKRFGNEAILHPLCILHQTFRDQLSARIPKGAHFVHSITVSCRSTSTGKIIHSNYGLAVSGISIPDAEEAIKGWACMFYAA
ncbi:MAG: hypothetical protein HZA20_09120 [Nitrospirae bacterium]|nr:hypothetical protein [Nitrospirota bacterium]